MVQEFHVTRCVTCENFQVQQVKKSTTKWSCKVCGEKQSLLKEYGRGSAPDCRRHVQKLNAMRGALVEEQERTACSLWEQEQEPDDNTEHESTEAQIQTSRWSKYLGTPKEVDIEQEPEDDMVLMDRQNCLNSRMTCRKRKRETPSEQAFQPVKQLTSTRTTGFNRSRTIGITHSLFKSSQTSNSLVQSSQTSLKESRIRHSGSNPHNVKQSRSETTGLSQHKPSEWNQLSPPSSTCTKVTPTDLSTGCGSRWTCFLTSDPPTTESTLKGDSDVTLRRSQPSHHTSSMFDMGEDFSIEEF